MNKRPVRQYHLTKSGSGFSFSTACGRNLIRTPVSVKWGEFKKLDAEMQCAKCANSRQVLVNLKHDAK